MDTFFYTIGVTIVYTVELLSLRTPLKWGHLSNKDTFSFPENSSLHQDLFLDPDWTLTLTKSDYVIVIEMRLRKELVRPLINLPPFVFAAKLIEKCPLLWGYFFRCSTVFNILNRLVYSALPHTKLHVHTISPIYDSATSNWRCVWECKHLIIMAGAAKQNKTLLLFVAKKV